MHELMFGIFLDFWGLQYFKNVSKTGWKRKLQNQFVTLNP